MKNMTAITIIMFRANSTVELVFELVGLDSTRYEGEGELDKSRRILANIGVR